jgi:hypothetical protein
MFDLRRGSLLLLALLVSGLAAPAGDDKPQARTDPPSTTLEVRLIANKDTYSLDRGGKTAAQYRKSLQEALAADGFPATPPVDLVLEFRNTGDQEIQVWIGGDTTELKLELDGPGVVTGVSRRAVTEELRKPKTVTIAPGKSYTLPIKELEYGTRSQVDGAYWTEAGDYTLTATYKTAVSPAPKGAKGAGGGFGFVTARSAPIKLKVEEVKK